MNNPRDVGIVGLRVFWGWWTMGLGGGVEMTLYILNYIDLISMFKAFKARHILKVVV